MDRNIAIVRNIPDSFHRCITSVKDEPPIEVSLARTQHGIYCRTLESMGLDLIRLPADETLPDCCFTEDTAVVLDELAIITRPGADTRLGETLAMEEALSPFRLLRHITPPGRMDGGDVIRAGRDIFVGISARTNREAASQLREISAPFGYRVIEVPVKDTLHLKSVCTYIGRGCFLVAKGHFDESLLSGYELIHVAANEKYCADALGFDNQVLIPSGFPATAGMIREKGFDTISLDMSEIRKADGALTCLSVILSVT